MKYGKIKELIASYIIFDKKRVFLLEKKHVPLLPPPPPDASFMAAIQWPLKFNNTKHF